jgi:hypothetical protein
VTLKSDNISWSASQHFLGFFAYRFNFSGIFVDGYDGWLVYDDAFATCVHKSVGSAEVNGKIAGEYAEQRPQIVHARSAGITVR